MFFWHETVLDCGCRQASCPRFATCSAGIPDLIQPISKLLDHFQRHKAEPTSHCSMTMCWSGPIPSRPALLIVIGGERRNISPLQFCWSRAHLFLASMSGLCGDESAVTTILSAQPIIPVIKACRSIKHMPKVPGIFIGELLPALALPSRRRSQPAGGQFTGNDGYRGILARTVMVTPVSPCVRQHGGGVGSCPGLMIGS